MKDENKNKNLRYGLGIMSYNIIASHKHFNHGIKEGEGVVFIHKDDFKMLLDSLPEFDNLKTNMEEIYRVMEGW